jgi:hypothetical protein
MMISLSRLVVELERDAGYVDLVGLLGLILHLSSKKFGSAHFPLFIPNISSLPVIETHIHTSIPFGQRICYRIFYTFYMIF